MKRSWETAVGGDKNKDGSSNLQPTLYLLSWSSSRWLGYNFWLVSGWWILDFFGHPLFTCQLSHCWISLLVALRFLQQHFFSFDNCLDAAEGNLISVSVMKFFWTRLYSCFLEDILLAAVNILSTTLWIWYLITGYWITRWMNSSPAMVWFLNALDLFFHRWVYLLISSLSSGSKEDNHQPLQR